jgi:DNA-binding NarL/FixJ family response regulator
MIHVLIVDDQEIVSAGLQVILGASPSLQVVGVANNGAEALALAEQLRPDVVLMDLNMPVMNGVQAIGALRARLPTVAVIALTTYDEESWVRDAIRAGAAGYLLKDTGRSELVAAIEGVMAGGSPLDPAVAGTLLRIVRQGAVPAAEPEVELSERERAVLRLLASGLSNGAIADRLALAEGTVKNHVTTIFAKLDVTDRAQATAFAWRHGLVSPED